MTTTTATPSLKKIIMVVSNNQNISQHLKLELELRKVCDVVDTRSVGSNPKKLLEELILKKDTGEYNDYKLYIIDDSIAEAYEFAENLKHNYPRAYFVLLSSYGRPKTTAEIRSNPFYRLYRGDKLEKKTYASLARKNDVELTESEKGYKAEYLHAVKTEQLGFATSYIKKPIKDYGLAAKKVKQILVVGTYRYEDAAAIKRHIKSPEDIRKEKSEKALRNLTAGIGGAVYTTNRHGRPVPVLHPATGKDVMTRLGWKYSSYRSTIDYGKDITEPEHAAEIVRRLRSYERDTKQELEKIQKVIREWEDRFPSIVQDPKAFEIAQEKEEEKRNDNSSNRQ